MNTCRHPPPSVHLEDNLSDDSWGYGLGPATPMAQSSELSKGLWWYLGNTTMPNTPGNNPFFCTCFLNNSHKVSAREWLGGSLNLLTLGVYTLVYKQHPQPSLMGGSGASRKAVGSGW